MIGNAVKQNRRERRLVLGVLRDGVKANKDSDDSEDLLLEVMAMGLRYPDDAERMEQLTHFCDVLRTHYVTLGRPITMRVVNVEWQLFQHKQLSRVAYAPAGEDRVAGRDAGRAKLLRALECRFGQRYKSTRDNRIRVKCTLCRYQRPDAKKGRRRKGIKKAKRAKRKRYGSGPMGCLECKVSLCLACFLKHQRVVAGIEPDPLQLAADPNLRD